MKLAAYLAEHNISDADFAVSIGVERQAVHRYRSGQRTPTKAVLQKIFEVTSGRVSANDFFDFSDEQPATSEPERVA